VALGGLTGVAVAVGVARSGVAGPVLVVGVPICLLLVRLPRMALAALLGSVVVLEVPDFVFPFGEAFYDPIASGLTIPDLLLLVLVVGTALELRREGVRPRPPGAFTFPLLLLALAVAAGAVTGYFAGVGVGELVRTATPLAYLMLLPLLMVNLVSSDGQLRVFAAAAAVLAAYKAVTGTAVSLTGAGEVIEGGSISFYEPVANALLLAFVLAALAAAIRRVKLPAWVWAAVPFATLALLLSYRRSFWIGAVFAILLVALVASRRRGRALAWVAGAGVCLVLVATLTLGQGDRAYSGIAGRVRLLEPGQLSATSGDRYRTDEQRNVLDEIEENPIIGVGLGQPWRVRHPLSETHDRRYVHRAVLWYWLHFGLLGVAAYLWLMGTALLVAFRVWRRHHDGLVRVCALASFGVVAALLVVELTATFTGIEARMSIGLGALFGWLAAAAALAGEGAVSAGGNGYAGRAGAG
jgi:hypothetical protein